MAEETHWWPEWSCLNATTLRWVRRALLAVNVGGLAYLSILVYRYFSGLGTTRRHHLETATIALLCTILLLASTLTNRSSAYHRPSEQPSWSAVHALGAMLAIAVLSRSLVYGFFSDDFVLLELAQRGQYLATAEFVRPVPLMVWGLLDTFGAPPAVFHAVNLALHALNGWLVWRLARSLGFGASSATAAAGLFLSSPLSVEAVVWPAGIQDLLMTTAVLGACASAANDAGRWRPGLLFVLAIAAVASKETGIVLPLPVILVLWMQGQQLLRHQRLVASALAGTLVSASLRLWYRSPDPDFFIDSRYELKEFLVRPLAYLAVPTHQEWAREHALALVAFTLLIGYAAVRVAWQANTTCHRRRCAGFLLWIYVAVLPLQQYLFVSDHLEGARYLYLPSVGWALLVVELLASAFLSSRATIGGLLPGAPLLIGNLLLLNVNMESWSAAAAARDHILASARAVQHAHTCSSAEFAGIPEHVDGAQLFRNGFYQALELPKSSVAPPSTSGCSFVWDGQRFLAGNVR